MKSPFFRTAVLALLLAGCGRTTDRDEASAAGTSTAGAAAAQLAAAAGSPVPGLPTVLVYKDPSCGCCTGWVDHMRAAGFEVDVRDTDDLPSVKRDAAVPADLASCHTALVDGYVVEGHVPADLVKKVVAERPDVAGLAVPGMPVGSPGMEGPGARPYSVLAFTRDGERAAYAEVDPRP